MAAVFCLLVVGFLISSPFSGMPTIFAAARVNPTESTANRGGGGGAASATDNSHSSGAAGGSGVVIVRYAPVTSGSSTQTVDNVSGVKDTGRGVALSHLGFDPYTQLKSFNLKHL